MYISHYKEIKDELLRINRDLRIEGRLLFPSYSILELNLTFIINLLNQSSIVDDKFNNWTIGQLWDLKNLKADIEGELAHDYEKRNKRYKSKWDRLYNKIVDFISDYRNEFSV
jgi:hypothetical protein